MAYFSNPYSPKTQWLSGIMGIVKDIAPLIALFMGGPGAAAATTLGTTALGAAGKGTGTMGPVGGIAGQNILKQAPQEMSSPTYNPPPQANMIPQDNPLGQPSSQPGGSPLGGTLGQAVGGQSGLDPQVMKQILAYILSQKQQGGGQFGQGFQG